jgi:beta-glucosidase
MRISRILFLAIIAILLAGPAGAKVRKSALLQYDRQIDGIISRMTIKEKVIMLHAKFMFVSAEDIRLKKQITLR